MAGKRRIPTPDELRDYNYAVAGHAGTLCDEDGELFIKPCTPSELNWYQTVEQNGLRDFAQVMPVYLGELRLSAPEDVDEAVMGLIADVGEVQQTKEQLKASIIEQVARAPMVVVAAAAAAKPAITLSGQTEAATGWVPSRGKRIKTDRAVVLGNASFGYKKANILDVKLGVRLWADDAAPEKKRRFDVITAETTHKELGFRIAGMRVFRGSAAQEEWDDEGYKVYDKEYGRTKVTIDNVVGEFRKFVFNKEAGVDDDLGRAVCAGFLRELKRVEDVLLRHETRIYSSSLLFLFEGDGENLTAAIQKNNDYVDEAFEPSPSDTPTTKPIPRTNTRMDSGIELEDEDFGLDDDFEEPRLPPIFSLKMIDFAHAQFTPGEGPDENTLVGVRSLIRIFRELAGEADADAY
ncbi:Inositol polyphosphate multikinase [Escovopsis weberi]|uniref:Kinase n=1 Tax=Escovopsis weberi TaxID=150374 RepID=A0A0M9VV60_ESCWE|nr:Inositol polyphosphate multikinase [Escovopsis weberi]